MENNNEQESSTFSKSYRYYDEISQGYDELHSEEQKTKITTILSKIKIKNTDNVLDVGGGTGILSEMVHAKITNLEPSQKMLDEGIKKKRNFKPINAGAEDIDVLFKENEFDKTLCLTAAHHFKDMDAALKGIKKTTKPQGNVIITLLKRAQTTPQIIKTIKEYFEEETLIEDEKDIILILNNNKE